MTPSVHHFHDLFAQLGLPSDNGSIARFIDHHPLPASMSLADAPFWTPVQAAFLREEIHGDADWAELVDQLGAALRHH